MSMLRSRSLFQVVLLVMMVVVPAANGQTKLSSAVPAAGGQAPQAGMEALARKLGLGAPRPDSPSPRPTKSGVAPTRSGYYQCFERGCVYSSAQTGVRAVYGSIFTRFVKEGAELKSLGFPTSDEQPCKAPSGFRYQTFEGGRLLWRASTNGTARSPNPSGDPADCTGEQVYEVVTTTSTPLYPTQERATAVPAGPNEATLAPAAQPASGRFRVTLNGFLVVHETADHSFEVDGKRDEVFILAEAADFNGAREILTRTSPQSAVMGDIQGYGERIPAGRASDLGGLRSSDQMPPTEPWRRQGSVGSRRPPMLLWEGTLTQGERAAVIVPTIWEWDGPSDLLRQYRAGMSGSFARFVRTLNPSETILANMIGPCRCGIGTDRPVGFEPTGNAADRPIGVEVATGSFLAANEAQQGQEWFVPKRMVLSYEIARQAAADTSAGFGPGVFTITYRDHPELAGIYTLYVQVERLD